MRMMSVGAGVKADGEDQLLDDFECHLVIGRIFDVLAGLSCRTD
jgi:hypothetical protein